MTVRLRLTFRECIMSMKVLTSIVQMYVYLPGLHANMPLSDPTVLLCDILIHLHHLHLVHQWPDLSTVAG